MKKKVYILIITVLVLGFSISLDFASAYQSELKIESNNANIFLWGVRILVIGAMIGATCFSLLRKKDVTLPLILFIATAVLQFLPHVLRIYLVGPKPDYSLAILICFFTLLAYASILIGSDLQNAKLEAYEQKARGKEIPVQKEESFENEDGSFRGCE